MHRPLGGELSHPRVDERVARASVLPRGERLRIVPPAVASRAEVAARRARIRREQLVVEVAPAQLPNERLATFPSERALGDLERGHAAEMEVGGEARGALDREVVTALVVARKSRPQPALQPGPAVGFAATWKTGGGCPSAGQVEEPGSEAERDALEQRRRARGLQHRSPRRRAPAPPVRPEHAERPVRPARGEVARRDDRDARERPHLEACIRGGPAEPLLASARERTHVLGQVDGPGTGLGCNPERLLHGVAATDDEPAPTLPQGRCEVRERVEQEGHAVRCAKAAQNRVVQDEQGHDGGAPLACARERGVVVQPQVAREEHHDAVLAALTGVSRRRRHPPSSPPRALYLDYRESQASRAVGAGGDPLRRGLR